MKLQYNLVPFLLMLIVLLPTSIQRRALALDDCSIEITRTSPSRLPQATKPGEIIVKFWFDLTTSDPQNTQLSVEASGSNIDVLSKTISMSTRSGSVRIYVHTKAGERASLIIKVTCRVNGVTDTDSKDMGNSYIVYIPPSWSPSITPREISKRDEIALKVDRLNDVDDGVGELFVTAKLGSSTYRLRRVSRGLYRSEVGVNFVDSPSGTREITFTVTKSYSGVTAVSRKDSTVRVLGEPPSVNFTPPTQVYRGDVLRVVVSENDGDSLTGALTAFGREYTLERGENLIEVPRDIEAGQHQMEATVEDVDGSSSGSWTLEILNVPPQVEISLDRDMAIPGDTVNVQVSVEDDSPGTNVRLIVTGEGLRNEFEMGENGGSLEFRIPEGFSGELTFTANAVDRDGESSTSTESITVGVPPSISGEIPSTVHRGEEYTVDVQGDDVGGYLDFMGERISINGAGVYRLVIPRDVRAGDYVVSAYVTSPFGGVSERWNVLLENRPPTVDIDVNPSEASPGETVVVSASYSDDAPGLRTTLYIDGRAIQLPGSSSAEDVEFTVPEGKDSIEISIEAVDMDGAVARDSAVLVVSNVGQDGGSGSDEDGNGTGDGSSDSMNTTTGSSDTGGSGHDGEGVNDIQEVDDVRDQSGDFISNVESRTEKSQESTEELPEASQLHSNVGNSGSENGTSNITGHKGTFSVTVVPSNPEVGDDVSVTATPHGVRGSVWIVDPSGTTVKEVPVRNRTTFHFTVRKEGIWHVRWAYLAGGETLFGHMELNVTAPREGNILHRTNMYRELPSSENVSRLTDHVRNNRGEINPFRPSCRVLRRDRSRSWDIEIVIAIMAVSLAGMLVIRRRIS